MQQAKLLKKTLRSERSGRIARRIQIIIILLTTGDSFAAVGLVTSWDRRTVARWHGRFEGCTRSIGGIKKALSDRPRAGRPAKIPRKCLEEARKWCEGRAVSTREVSSKLEELSGTRLSDAQVRRYMRAWGLSRKKSQPISVNRAAMSAVYGWRHRLLGMVAEYGRQGYTVVTQDESHFADSTRTAKYWAEKCLRIFLPWSGDRRRFSMLCSMAIDGRAFFNHAERINTQSFLEHMDRVYQSVGKMVLVLDKAPWHMSEDAMKYFKKRDIILVWYPTGHPYLNPVEEAWSTIKRQMQHSIRYADAEAHLAAFYKCAKQAHMFDYDFVRFWKRGPPKGIMRPVIKEKDAAGGDVGANRVDHRPKPRGQAAKCAPDAILP